MQYKEAFNDPSLQAYSETYQQQNFGRQLFQTGTLVPFGLNYVQETTVFREFGPLSGNTVRVAYEVAPKIGDVTPGWASSQAMATCTFGTPRFLATSVIAATTSISDGVL